MKFVLFSCLLALVICSCNSESAVCNCYETSKIDSILSFAVTKDSVLIDVNDDVNSYPKASTNNSMIALESIVQVTCGYANFKVSSKFDTIIVTASGDSTKACVDWMVKFKYKATVSIVGIAKHVRFISNSKSFTANHDTLLRF
jgi:hypothetical protein